MRSLALLYDQALEATPRICGHSEPHPMYGADARFLLT
jgi:hypothetical protein